MTKALLYFISNILIILALAAIIPNFVVEDVFAAIVFLIVLTILNWIVVPILEILTLPINFLTLGLVGLLINLGVTWITIAYIEGVDVNGSFGEQFIGIILLSIGLSVGRMIIDHTLGYKNKAKH